MKIRGYATVTGKSVKNPACLHFLIYSPNTVLSCMNFCASVSFVQNFSRFGQTIFMQINQKLWESFKKCKQVNMLKQIKIRKNLFCAVEFFSYSLLACFIQQTQKYERKHKSEFIFFETASSSFTLTLF